MTTLAESAVPLRGGSHCAGIGCEHDDLVASGLEPEGPRARTTARHRGASSGRRARQQLAAAPEPLRSPAHLAEG